MIDNSNEIPEPRHPECNPEIDTTFQNALDFFINTEPTKRPYIARQKTSKKFAKIVEYINERTLPVYVKPDIEFSLFQTIVYCAAWTAAKCNGTKLTLPPTDTSNRNNSNKKPKWQIRLEHRVEDLRSKIGKLTHYIAGNRNRKLVKNVEDIQKNYQTHSIHEDPNTQLTHFLDTLKQKLIVTASRLKRYNACTLRKTQNAQFTNNEKQFYRNLRNTTENKTPSQPQHNDTPTPGELQQFWAKIWENPVVHNTEADWIREEETKHAEIPSMEFEFVSIDTFQDVLKSLHNWKAPGTDHIHNYFYKKITHIHPLLFNFVNNFIKNPNMLPEYITTGITYMLPKDPEDLSNPAKFRPITCLQTIYKIITSCLTRIIYLHSENNKILVEQQKGCRKYSQGCKEQLTIDAIILKIVQKKKQDLYSMYIDYKKAYDSVPHSWLLKVLTIYKIHPEIISFLNFIMNRCQARIQTPK